MFFVIRILIFSIAALDNIGLIKHTFKRLRASQTVQVILNGSAFGIGHEIIYITLKSAVNNLDINFFLWVYGACNFFLFYSANDA